MTKKIAVWCVENSLWQGTDTFNPNYAAIFSHTPHSTGVLTTQCTNMEPHGILLFPQTNDTFKSKWVESVVTTKLNQMQKLPQNKVKEMLPAMVKTWHLMYPRRRAWSEGGESILKVNLVLLISQHKFTYIWTGLIMWNNCLQPKHKNGFKK
jgi:hypothetical protein